MKGIFGKGSEFLSGKQPFKVSCVRPGVAKRITLKDSCLRNLCAVRDVFFGASYAWKASALCGAGTERYPRRTPGGGSGPVVAQES